MHGMATTKPSVSRGRRHAGAPWLDRMVIDACF